MGAVQKSAVDPATPRRTGFRSRVSRYGDGPVRLRNRITFPFLASSQTTAHNPRRSSATSPHFLRGRNGDISGMVVGLYGVHVPIRIRVQSRQNIDRRPMKRQPILTFPFHARRAPTSGARESRNSWVVLYPSHGLRLIFLKPCPVRLNTPPSYRQPPSDTSAFFPHRHCCPNF